MDWWAAAMFEDLAREILANCFDQRFGDVEDATEPTPLILADWLDEHQCPHLALIFRREEADHEGWAIDILAYGLPQAEEWAASWTGGEGS